MPLTLIKSELRSLLRVRVLLQIWFSHFIDSFLRHIDTLGHLKTANRVILVLIWHRVYVSLTTAQLVLYRQAASLGWTNRLICFSLACVILASWMALLKQRRACRVLNWANRLHNIIGKLFVRSLSRPCIISARLEFILGLWSFRLEIRPKHIESLNLVYVSWRVRHTSVLRSYEAVVANWWDIAISWLVAFFSCLKVVKWVGLRSRWKHGKVVNLELIAVWDVPLGRKSVHFLIVLSICLCGVDRYVCNAKLINIWWAAKSLTLLGWDRIV